MLQETSPFVSVVVCATRACTGASRSQLLFLLLRSFGFGRILVNTTPLGSRVFSTTPLAPTQAAKMGAASSAYQNVSVKLSNASIFSRSSVKWGNPDRDCMSGATLVTSRYPTTISISSLFRETDFDSISASATTCSCTCRSTLSILSTSRLAAPATSQPTRSTLTGSSNKSEP